MNKINKELNYHFHPSEPSIFVEVYLPKKSSYQGKLYQVLTDGFDWGKVCNTLSNNSEKIQKFLKNSSSLSNFCEDHIPKEQLYWGYSMYEVDGVFCGEGNKTFEERTQVIRFMFRPSISSVDSSIKNEKEEFMIQNKEKAREIRKMLRSALREIKSDRLNSAIMEKYKDSEDLYRNVVDYINQWESHIHVFLFGYILFELCEVIRIVDQPEEEIWLTSFWNLEINRVISG